MDFHPVEANLRESFRVLAKGRVHGDVLELPGLTIASLGAAFQMFNTAFLSSPVTDKADLESRLESARLHFRSRRIEWAFWLCDGWLEGRVRRNVTQIFQRFGLRLSSEMPGMIGSPLGKPRRSLPALDMRPVNSESTLNDFRAIGSVSFHVPYDWFSEVFDASVAAGQRDFLCNVGYLHGEPVATSASLRSNGVVGLYNIATAPAYRGRGYGEAITRMTMQNALKAGEPVVLQSTSQGLRIYERLGFREVTRILVYNSI
ncbi:MAG: GNAT family N-acetyltransferase [Terriglobia bacterium]